LYIRKKGVSLMKKLLTATVIFWMFMMPFAVYAQSDQHTTQVPPIEQSLVPEGDFALKLVTALKIGTVENKAEAEDMLSSVGIAPRNGWIADYPVTPDIIGELESAIIAAADANKLPIGKDEALKAFRDLTAEFELEVASGPPDDRAQTQSQRYGEYSDPMVINNYYYDVGPPVVTYYPPPWDYYYLYAWVPYPFWWQGFHFGGFFVLHDFHRVVIVKKKPCVITNHVRHPVTKNVAVIDPVRRTHGNGFRDKNDGSFKRGFQSPEAKKGGESIFRRSHGRMGDSNVPLTKKDVTSMTSRSERRSERQFLNEERRSPSTSNRREGIARQSSSEPKAKKDRLGTTSPSLSERRFSRPRDLERPREMSSPRSSIGQPRSFSAPGVTRERSFSRPSDGRRDSGFSGRAGKSFSAPGRSFTAPSRGSRDSSGGFRAGGGDRSPRSGSFAGGGGRGGCRGRC
jgi:hypothetical protein